MIDLIAEAASIQKFIEGKGWDFFFIGGIAVQVWGQPRVTQDIDLTVFTNLRNEPEYIDAFLARYSPKFADADQFALTNRVLPMFTKEGVGIDLTLGGLATLVRLWLDLRISRLLETLFYGSAPPMIS